MEREKDEWWEEFNEEQRVLGKKPKDRKEQEEASERARKRAEQLSK